MHCSSVPIARFVAPSSRWSAGILVLVAAALLVSIPAAASAQDDRVQIVIPPTDSVAVELVEPICSSRAEAGAPVEFRVARDLELSGHVVIEAGSPVQATVVEAEGNGRGGSGGKLVVELTEMVARDGARIPLDPASARIERVGGDRGLLAKIFTLWLIKGGDPCLTTSDQFHVRAERAVSVRVPRNGS